MTENIKSKTDKKTSAIYALHNNPTLSVAQVCELLDIGRQSAYLFIKQKGFLIKGLPILRVGRRQLMSSYVLREILGITHLPKTEGKQ